MATPDLRLSKPYALIQPGPSILSGSASGSPVGFGEIMLIYETADEYSGGDEVLYKTDGQILVFYEGVQYALVRQENILYKETPPV